MDIKTMEEIVELIEDKYNPFIAWIKTFFTGNVHYVLNKSYLNELKGIDVNNYYSFDAFLFFIKLQKIDIKIKIDSYITFLYYNSNIIFKDFHKLNKFIKDIVDLSKIIDIYNISYISSWKELILMIIDYDIDFSKHPYLIGSIYSQLFKLLFQLVKIKIVTPQDFLGKFSKIFNNMPLIYQDLTKWIIHFDVYYDYFYDQNQMNDIITKFLNSYELDSLRELNTYYMHPNPIKFCEYIEKRYSKNNQLDNLLEIFIKYYENHATNYVPPIFLREEYIEKENIIKFIQKNIKNTKYYQEEEYFKELLSQLMKKKESFKNFENFSKIHACFFLSNTEKHRIYTLLNQNKFSLREKMQLLIDIYKEYPELDSNHIPFSKLIYNMSNKSDYDFIIKKYFELIKITENYDDFKDLIKEIDLIIKTHNYFSRSSKYYNFIIRIYEKISELIKTDGFQNLDKIKDIIKFKGFFDEIRNFSSLREYIEKNFFEVTPKLYLFLYSYALLQAEIANDRDYTINLSKEFDELNDPDIIKSHEADYQFKKNHLIALIEKGNIGEIFQRANELIIYYNEKNKNQIFKRYDSIIGILEYFLGNYEKALNIFSQELKDFQKFQNSPFWRNSKNNLNDSSIKRENILNFFIDFLSLEIKTPKWDFERIQNDLYKKLVKYKLLAENKSFFCFFDILEVYNHYNNLYIFLNVIDKIKQYGFNHKVQCDINKKGLENITETRFCIHWLNLKNLWIEILSGSNITIFLNKYAIKNMELLNQNPLLSHVADITKKFIPMNNPVYKIFNNDENSEDFQDTINFKYYDKKGKSNSKLKITFFCSQPNSYEDIGLNEIVDCLNEKLSGKDHFSLLIRTLTTFDVFQETILETKPDIIHFYGHSYEKKLIFLDSNNNSFDISNEEILDFFKVINYTPKCIILTACNSFDLANSLSNYAEITIGIRDDIDYHVSVDFIRGFYQGISNDYDIKKCINLGKNKIFDIFNQHFGIFEHTPK